MDGIVNESDNFIIFVVNDYLDNWSSFLLITIYLKINHKINLQYS